MTSKEKLFKYIDENEKKYGELNGALFDSPEPCFMEFKTFEIQKSFMENEGFSITTPVAGLDTAFIAEYGEGGPVIAIVDSMDALPGASTDMSDVSWTAPTGNIGVACFAVGTRPHNWAMTAQGKSSAALKGVWRAAKMMCSAAYDLYTDSELLGRAKAAHERQRGGREYTTLIPRDTRPGMYD